MTLSCSFCGHQYMEQANYQKTARILTYVIDHSFASGVKTTPDSWTITYLIIQFEVYLKQEDRFMEDSLGMVPITYRTAKFPPEFQCCRWYHVSSLLLDILQQSSEK